MITPLGARSLLYWPWAWTCNRFNSLLRDQLSPRWKILAKHAAGTILRPSSSSSRAKNDALSSLFLLRSLRMQQDGRGSVSRILLPTPAAIGNSKDKEITMWSFVVRCCYGVVLILGRTEGLERVKQNCKTFLGANSTYGKGRFAKVFR